MFFSTIYQNNSLSEFIFHFPDTNREAIASAGGVVPLLTLSKSYDPRVQQYAVGAIFNLTQSGIFDQRLISIVSSAVTFQKTGRKLWCQSSFSLNSYMVMEGLFFTGSYND